MEPCCASLIFSGPGHLPEERSAFGSIVPIVKSSYLVYSQLALQTKFHGPLAYPPPYPPRPIFQRPRHPELVEIGPLDVHYETSFYKNAYAMVGLSTHTVPSCLRDLRSQFTDATTYQALFYFLVIKPGITLCMSIVLIVLVPVSYVLVLPAPLMLRFVRGLGIWQANVAVEGLYYQVT